MTRPRPRARNDRGVALVELALVLPLLALIVFGAVDLGRVFRLENRLENAAREGGAVVQFHPQSIDAGCDGTRNVTDRVTAEEPGLASLPGFAVTVAQRDPSSGTLLPADGYRGCGSSSSHTPAPGTKVLVTVTASFSPVTPLVSVLTGSRITVTGSQEVVVQA